MAHDIQVHYFAAARDLAGLSTEHVGLPERCISLEQLRGLLGSLHPKLAPFLPRMRLAVNDDLHVQLDRVEAGDEISVLPPVAGGSANPAHCCLQETPLSVDAAIEAVKHPGAGGIAVFLGVVRDHAEQGAVSRLDYEAHTSLAHKEMLRILLAIAAELPGTRLSVQHRVGSLQIGDLAVVVAASAAHRAQAFAACRAAIDRIKESVPIWKKEWAPDGSALWVNLEESSGAAKRPG